MRVLALASVLCTVVLVAQANQHDRERRDLEARMEETRARLQLTDEQARELMPVLEGHFEAQHAIIEKHGVDPDNRDRSRQLDPQTLGALRTALDEQSVATEERIAELLTAQQLAEFRKIRTEQEQRYRERIRAAAIDAVGERLRLSEQQMATVVPILADHFDAQLTILQQHDIGNSERRPSLRQLFALGKDIDQSNAEVLQRLRNTGALSGRQLQEYEKMMAEQKEERRARLRSR